MKAAQPFREQWGSTLLTEKEAELERLRHQLSVELENHKATLQRSLIDYKADIDQKLSSPSWQTNDYGLLVLRSLLLINGGAIIGLVAFVGNLLAKNDKLATALAHATVPSLGFFVFGVGLSILSAAFAFGTQIAFYEARDDDPTKLPKLGIGLRVGAIAAGVGSAACFLMGALGAISAIVPHT